MKARAPDGHGLKRARMVERLLEARGIRDARVLDAMRTVPRHLFVEEALALKAYTDHALPIGEKQTISRPWVVARTAELLEIGADDRVLEIGTGSGYQAAVLSRLARHVYAIERIAELARRARATIASLGYINVSIKVFDGTYGWGEWAPYRAIAVAAAVPEPPPPLLEQLAPGGRLVIPLGGGEEQHLVRVTREADGFRTEIFESVSFVPLIGRFGHGA